MEEYIKTIRRLLNKAKKAQNVDEALKWTNAVANLLSLNQASLDIIKEIKIK